MIKFDFAEWLQKEMATCAGAVGGGAGGGSYTNSIAVFARPLFSTPVRRGSSSNDEPKKHKKKKSKKHRKKH